MIYITWRQCSVNVTKVQVVLKKTMANMLIVHHKAKLYSRVNRSGLISVSVVNISDINKVYAIKNT